jgi:transcriptional regulator with XRE-family HTH domain
MKDRIRKIREYFGHTQLVMAKKIGCSKGALQTYEEGKSIPGGKVVAAITALGEDANWLLTGEGDMLRNAAPDKECTDPRCVQHLHAEGHILAKAPLFDTELLGHIYAELHAYKDENPDILTKEQEMDVVSLSSMFLQAENRREAALICAIVQRWFDKNGETAEEMTRVVERGYLKAFGTVTKVDLISNEEEGYIDIAYDTGDIYRFLKIIFDQIPDKNPAIKKAKETISTHSFYKKHIGVGSRPFLDKRHLKQNRKFLISKDEL